MASLLRRPALRLTLVAFLVLGLQTTLCVDLKPLGVTPDLMLLGATASGVVAGSQKGALGGFVFGIMFDLVLVTPFGVSPLIYGLAGFAAGYVQTLTIDPTWYLSMVTVAVTSTAGVAGLALLRQFISLDGRIPPDLVRDALAIGTINGLLAPFVMPVQRWCFGIKRAIA